MLCKKDFLRFLTCIFFVACDQPQSLVAVNPTPMAVESATTPGTKESASPLESALEVKGLPSPVSNQLTLSLTLASGSLPAVVRDSKVRFLVADGASATCDSQGTWSSWVAAGNEASLDLSTVSQDGEKLLCIELRTRDNVIIPNGYTFRWTKDTVAPTLSFQEVPASRVKTATMSLSVNSSESIDRFVFIRKSTPQSFTEAECNESRLEDFTTVRMILSKPFEVTSLEQSGTTAICIRALDAAGNLSSPLYSKFRHGNLSPSEPTLVTLIPTAPTKDSTLFCTPNSGGEDPDGDAVSPLSFWYRNGTLISGETGATLALNSNVGFVKGDSFRCEVAFGDALTLTTPVASSSFALLNSAPRRALP